MANINLTLTPASPTGSLVFTIGMPGPGVPPAGLSGQILAKASNTSYDTEWVNIADVSAVWGQITGTLSNQTDLSNALSAKYDASNPAGYITASALSGYATESWVQGQGYITGVSWGSITGTLGNQTDLSNALSEKADLTGAVFTGGVSLSFGSNIIAIDPVVPQFYVDNGTSAIQMTAEGITFPDFTVQTTAFTGAVPTSWGSITGTLSSQTDLQNALNDKAPLASPALTGVPTAPTAPTLTSTTQLATTAFVQQELAAGTAVAKNLEIEVRNQTGSSLSAGEIVYINGATGNKPTAAKALATGDSTSAQTIGFVKSAIANNGTGMVIVRGLLENINTSSVSEGAQLYLSGTTAGAYTTTKPVAPIHLVYVGIVTRSHPTLGTIEVAVQNGFELEELHDVLITSPSNGQVLKYDSATSLWKNQTDLNSGVWGSITGTLSAQTDLQNALNAKYDATNPAGYITSSALSPYLLSSTAASTYQTISGMSSYLTISSAASTYYPLTNPSGYITSSALTGYALLSGANFTGNITASANSISARRIIGQPNAGVAGVNIGIGGTDTSSTTAGDIWISTGGTTLNYRDGTGAWRQILTNNQIGSIDTSSVAPALRVTQRGTGEAFRVEDSTTPDATAFVISNSGRVGVGVAPDALAAIKVDGYGIMFNDGTSLVTANIVPNLNDKANQVYLAQNYFNAITSWNYDGAQDQTTVYHSSDVIDALFNAWYSVVTITGNTTYGIASFGAGYVVYNGDLRNSTGQNVSIDVGGYILTGLYKYFN